MSLLELKQIGTVVRFLQDDFIVSEGETGNCMYIILDGQADVYLSSFDDLPIKVHEIQKGDFFGEMALLEKMPRSATIIAAKNTIAIKIDESNFEDLLAKRTDIAMRMLRTLSARLRKTNEELLLVKSGTFDKDDDCVNLSNYIGGDSIETTRTDNTVEKQENSSLTSSYKKEQSIPESHFERLLSNDIIQVLDLLPDDHSAYKYKIYQEDYEDKVLEKDVTCPICKNEFKADLIRTSCLQTDHREPLFRKVYMNMNPLASNIWTCPHCYYSQYYYSYHAIPVYKKKEIEVLLRKVKHSIKVSNTNKDDINVVFVKYFLAAFIEEHTPGPNMVNLGKCWLNLYWLYQDVSDKKMADIALTKAHYYYKEAYYNSRLRLSDEEELRLGVLVAELCTVRNEERDAYNLLAKLIVNKKMSSQLKQYASNLMYETKQTIKEMGL